MQIMYQIWNIYRYIKNSYNSTIKKQITSFKIGQSNRNFSKVDT